MMGRVFSERTLGGDRTPEPVKARGIDRLPFQINGGVSCLVYFQHGLPVRAAFDERLKAFDSEARERELAGALVEPIDPVPSEPEQLPPRRLIESRFRRRRGWGDSLPSVRNGPAV